MTRTLRPDEPVIRTIHSGDVLTMIFEHPKGDTTVIELNEVTMWGMLGPLLDFRHFLEHRAGPLDLAGEQEPLPF